MRQSRRLVTLLATMLAGCEAADSDLSVELTWLSNTTWLVQADGATVFADAALSRWEFTPPDFGRPESFHPVAVAPDTALVDEVLDALPLGRPAFVVVGHGHADHSIDLGLFAERSGAEVVGSRTVCRQAEAQGLPRDRCRSVEGGEVVDLTPRLQVRVIRWTHSGNPSDRLGRFLQAPKELAAPPEADGQGRLGQAPWEAFPNGGGARAYLFTYRSRRSLLRWLISDTGNPFTFDSVPRIEPDYLADVGVDLSHLDLGGADGTPRQWLADALAAEGADTLDLWLGYGNPGHVRQVTKLVSVRAFVPHHWDAYLAGFRPGIVRPFDRPELAAYFDSADVELAPQAQYMERYRLDRSGLTRLDSERLRTRLGLEAPPVRPARVASSPCSRVDSLSVPEVTRGGLAEGPHSVIWGGVRFWYCVAGAGSGGRPPVVFLHGGPGEGSQHFPALTGPSVESTLQVVYFDQRGSGRSERPWTREYGIDVLVQDVEELRKALGVERIAVLGHSFGGLLALEYAAEFPTRVSHVVTVSGLSDIPATQRSVCERLERLDPEAYARAVREPLPGGVCNSFAAYSGEEAERFSRASMYPDPRTGELVDSADGSGGLRNTGELSRALFAIPDILQYRFDRHDRLTMPVLVVAGREDHQIGLGPQEALARELPDATLVVLDDAGHFPHVDHPSAFAQALTSFLRPGGDGR